MRDFISEHKIIFDLPARLVRPYSWIEHIPFAFLLISSLEPDLVVELGVHTGNSFNAFCQAVKSLKLDTMCYGVDTWHGDKHSGFYEEDIYNELFEYIEKEYKDFSSLLKMTFDEALNSFADKTIDLLHIDGCHTFEAVKHDFYYWLPKLSDKGVVILHDTRLRDQGYGVWKLWEEVSDIYPSFEFKHGFGLGVLAAGREVDGKFLTFISDAKENDFYENLFFSLGNSIKRLKEKNNLEQVIMEKIEK